MWHPSPEGKPDAKELQAEAILVTDPEGKQIVRLVSNGEFWYEPDKPEVQPYKYWLVFSTYWCLQSDFAESLNPKRVPAKAIPPEVKQMLQGLAFLLLARYTPTNPPIPMDVDCASAIKLLFVELACNRITFDIKTFHNFVNDEARSKLYAAGALIAQWDGQAMEVWEWIREAMLKAREQKADLTAEHSA